MDYIPDSTKGFLQVLSLIRSDEQLFKEDYCESSNGLNHKNIPAIPTGSSKTDRIYSCSFKSTLKINKMKSNFLLEDGSSVQQFSSVEIEKVNSKHVLTVGIGAIKDTVKIEVVPDQRLLKVMLQPFVSDFDVDRRNEEENISFPLPANIELEGYFTKYENQRMYVVFRKLVSDHKLSQFY